MENTKTADMIMEELSGKLDVIAPLLTGEIVFLDYPIYENVGDLLIWRGTEQFFKRHKAVVLGQYNIENIKKVALQRLEQCSTIVFQGGGNFGDLWPRHQKLREDIIQKYPQKCIVILPQSVHYGDARELDKSCEILKRHPDLHIFLRDENSLAILRDRGVPNLKLCPDMAHSLWGTLSAPHIQYSMPLYLMRKDKEEAPLPPHIEELRYSFVDWGNLLTGLTGFIYKTAKRIVHRDEKMNNALPAEQVWRAASGYLIGRAVGLFSPKAFIETNRLHAMILSALLKKEVRFYDNSYGKISSYYDLWLKDMPNISMNTIH